jgi:hypothetical protein
LNSPTCIAKEAARLHERIQPPAAVRKPNAEGNSRNVRENAITRVQLHHLKLPRVARFDWKDKSTQRCHLWITQTAQIVNFNLNKQPSIESVRMIACPSADRVEQPTSESLKRRKLEVDVRGRCKSIVIPDVFRFPTD